MKKKLKWVIVGTAVLIAAIAFYAFQSGGKETQLVRLSRGNMEQYLEDTAQALVRDSQTIYIEGSGKVVSVNVEAGDAVKQGDLLLSLEKADLELQLREAEAGVEAAKAQLKGTELKNYANKIELARLALIQAENAYESAARNLENAEKLSQSNALSKDELEKIRDAYNAAKANLDSSKLQLEDARQGAPEYLKNSYKAQLEQAAAYRDSILRSVSKQEVRAPMDGIIIERLIDENSPAAPATPAFVIGNPDNLELQAEILADDANKIKMGNEVEITGKSIGGEILKGKVAKIAPAAKTVTSPLGINQKRVPVTIEILDSTGLIKPGYDMEVKIITLVKSDVIGIPDTAVFDYSGESMVFVVEEGKAVLTTVKKGMESGEYVEVLEGLEEGDIVISKPDNSIKEGIKIKLPDEFTKEGDSSVQ